MGGLHRHAIPAIDEVPRAQSVQAKLLPPALVDASGSRDDHGLNGGVKRLAVVRRVVKAQPLLPGIGPVVRQAGVGGEGAAAGSAARAD
jgi:hypothetical protein